MRKNELLKRYDDFFGQGTASKLLEAQKNYSNDQYIRINTSKITVEKIEKFLKENRVEYSKTFLKNCLKIEKSFFSLASSLPSLNGEIYIQDIASQIPVNCVDFSKYLKVKILDMAAAPGSKTTQLVEKLKVERIRYEIVALEPDKDRIQRLINNLQKQECKNVTIFNCRGQDFKSKDKFDIVLLDAPCSGNLVGDKSWLRKRDIAGIKKKANVQKSLLEKAYSLTKDGGIILYSTCSLEPEENEENVDWFLKKFNVEQIKINLDFNFKTSFLNEKSTRLMPYESKTQGFFVSSFTKSLISNYKK